MSNPTHAQVVQALREFGDRTSTAEANRLLQQVGGVNSLRNLPTDKYDAVIAAATNSSERRPDDGANMFMSGGKINADEIYNFWNAAGRRASEY